MKNKEMTVYLFSLFFVMPSIILNAWEEHKEDPHYEWFEGSEVAVCDEGIYADSNKGMFKLNVVEYDRVNDRYKVLCRCLKMRDLDYAEALSAPRED